MTTAPKEVMYGSEGQFTANQVKDYVNANLKDPKTIYDAAQLYGITNDQLATIMGIPVDQVNKYFTDANLGVKPTMYGDKGQFTAQQVTDFVNQNINNPKALSDAMSLYGMTLDQVAQATGITKDKLSSYLNPPPAAKPAAEKTYGPNGQFTASQIKSYIDQNIGNPAEIYNAAQMYGITNQQLADITGYSADQVGKYFSDYLANIAANPMTPAQAGIASLPKSTAPTYGTNGQFTAADIKSFVNGNVNNPQTIADTAKQYGITNADIAKSLGQTIDQVNAFLSPYQTTTAGSSLSTPAQAQTGVEIGRAHV